MKGACVFSCNLPPALWAEWPGCFTAEKWGGIDTEINLEKKSLPQKSLPQLLPGLGPETFESRVHRSTTELLPLLLGWVVEQWVGAVTWDRKMGGHVAFCL